MLQHAPHLQQHAAMSHNASTCSTRVVRGLQDMRAACRTVERFDKSAAFILQHSMSWSHLDNAWCFINAAAAIGACKGRGQRANEVLVALLLWHHYVTTVIQLHYTQWLGQWSSTGAERASADQQHSLVQQQMNGLCHRCSSSRVTASSLSVHTRTSSKCQKELSMVLISWTCSGEGRN